MTEKTKQRGRPRKTDEQRASIQITFYRTKQEVIKVGGSKDLAKAKEACRQLAAEAFDERLGLPRK
jgi:hypothetical protein